MEPETATFQNEPTVVQAEPVVEQHDNKKKKIFIIITVVVIALTAVGFWYFNKNGGLQQTQTPEEALESLKESSLPVTKTPEEQVKEVDALIKGSEPVKASEDDRLNQLRALSQ